VNIEIGDRRDLSDIQQHVHGDRLIESGCVTDQRIADHNIVASEHQWCRERDRIAEVPQPGVKRARAIGECLERGVQRGSGALVGTVRDRDIGREAGAVN